MSLQMFFLWQVKRTNGTALWICSTTWPPPSPPLCHSFILFSLSVSPSLSVFPTGYYVIFCLDAVCLYESDSSDSIPPFVVQVIPPSAVCFIHFFLLFRPLMRSASRSLCNTLSLFRSSELSSLPAPLRVAVVEPLSCPFPVRRPSHS